jgi:hypothetical protein
MAIKINAIATLQKDVHRLLQQVESYLLQAESIAPKPYQRFWRNEAIYVSHLRKNILKDLQRLIDYEKFKEPETLIPDESFPYNPDFYLESSTGKDA